MAPIIRGSLLWNLLCYPSDAKHFVLAPRFFEHLRAPAQTDSITACFQGEFKFWAKAANNIVRGKFSLSLVNYNSDFEDVQGCFINCFSSSYSVWNKRMLNELKRRNCMFYSRHCHQMTAHLGERVQQAIVGAALNYHTFCRLKKTFVIQNVIIPKRQKSVSIVENMPKMNKSKLVLKSCLSIQSSNTFLVHHLNH